MHSSVLISESQPPWTWHQNSPSRSTLGSAQGCVYSVVKVTCLADWGALPPFNSRAVMTVRWYNHVSAPGPLHWLYIVWTISCQSPTWPLPSQISSSWRGLWPPELNWQPCTQSQSPSSLVLFFSMAPVAFWYHRPCLCLGLFSPPAARYSPHVRGLGNVVVVVHYCNSSL